MEELICYKKFKIDKKNEFYSENLSYMIFDNINFKTLFDRDNKIFVFHRCDFRGATFKNVYFYKNNFDRADFISCTFVNCTFDSVDFGRSQINNCYFEDTKFLYNKYNTNTIQMCSFINSYFHHENFFSNINNCSFNKCKLHNCDFNKSSVENVQFYDSNLEAINLATLHAQRLSFSSCELKSTKFGLPYIFGYFFAKTNLAEICSFYRGKVTDANDMIQYSSNLFKEQRYYEYFNSKIILNKLNELDKVLETLIYKMFQLCAVHMKDEIENLFNCIVFYTTNSILKYKLVYKFINILEHKDIKNIPLNCQLSYKEGLCRIKFILTKLDFNKEFYLDSNDSISLISFYCNIDNYDTAKNCTEDFLSKFCKSVNFKDGYMFVEAKKGSWIIIFAVISTVALLMPNFIEKYSNLLIETEYKWKMRKKIIKVLNSSNNVDTLQEITQLASNNNIIPKKPNNKETDNLIKLLGIIKEFVDLVKISF